MVEMFCSLGQNACRIWPNQTACRNNEDKSMRNWYNYKGNRILENGWGQYITLSNNFTDPTCLHTRPCPAQFFIGNSSAAFQQLPFCSPRIRWDAKANKVDNLCSSSTFCCPVAMKELTAILGNENHNFSIVLKTTVILLDRICFLSLWSCRTGLPKLFPSIALVCPQPFSQNPASK